MTTTQKELTHRGAETEAMSAEPRLTPPVDVYENQDEILLLVDLPGVKGDALDVRLHQGTLDLIAWAEVPSNENGPRKITYARSFGVPQTVDPNGIAAKIDDGVLRITLQKSAAAKPRRIPVS